MQGVLNSKGKPNNIFEVLVWLQKDYNPSSLSSLGNRQDIYALFGSRG
jgi:hypothetical protein